MSRGLRKVLVPLGSVVFSFVVVTGAGAMTGGTGAVPPPSPTTAPVPSPADKIKIVYEQADGTVAPASAAGESMTLDITTESKADGIRVCVAQPIGAWKLDGTWAHIGPREYCRSLTPPEFPVVVKLVHP